MLINKELNDFLLNIFGVNYKKEITVEKLEEAEQLFQSLMAMKFESKLSTVDKKIIEDIKEYKNPIMWIANEVFSINLKKGWWTNLETEEFIERNRKEIIALIISEIFEALDGERKNNFDKHLSHRKNTEVELADAVIRIMDYCGCYQRDFLSPILFYLSEKENITIQDLFMKLDNEFDKSNININKYDEVINRLNEIDIHFSRDSMLHLEMIAKYCKGKTTLAGIKNKYEALLKICYQASQISQLSLSTGDESNEDDDVEMECLSLCLMMIFDYSELYDYDILGAMLEKIEFNNDREDHKKENRLKEDGKKV